MFFVSRTTLTSNSTTVTLNDIPQDADHLVIHASLRSAANERTSNLNLQLNGATSGYAVNRFRENDGQNSSLSASTNVIGTCLFPGNSASNAGQWGLMQIFLPRYSSNLAGKSVMINSQGDGSQTLPRQAIDFITATYSSTSPITSVTFSSGSQFLAGSIFTIYKIIKA